MGDGCFAVFERRILCRLAIDFAVKMCDTMTVRIVSDEISDPGRIYKLNILL